MIQAYFSSVDRKNKLHFRQHPIIRISLNSAEARRKAPALGIAGHVATTGKALRVDDAYQHPNFNPEVDRATGFRTRSILCVPLRDAGDRVFAVTQLLNPRDGSRIGEAHEARFAEFTASIGVILETWWTMTQRQREAGAIETSGAETEKRAG